MRDDLPNVQKEWARMNEEIWAMKPKPDPPAQPAPPAADATVRPRLKVAAPARKSSNRPPPPNAAPPPPKIAAVKTLLPPTRLKPAKRFPLSVKKSTFCNSWGAGSLRT
jgi:hypothetical protein